MGKNSIDTAMLWRISLLLRRDFFADISAELARRADEGLQPETWPPQAGV